MDEVIQELLEAADDPIHVEEPPSGLSYEALVVRLNRLQPKLSRIARRQFELDDGVEDATYFGDLELTRSIGSSWKNTFTVRFSNFGSLFTTWEPSDAEPLPPNVVAEIVEAVSYAGFQYIPVEALYTPYTGQNPHFKGATWWMRFFDYT